MTYRLSCLSLCFLLGWALGCGADTTNIMHVGSTDPTTESPAWTQFAQGAGGSFAGSETIKGTNHNYYATDDNGSGSGDSHRFEAIGTAKSMVVAVPGQGSQYIGVYQDAEGNWLSGEHIYRIRLPKNVPANMFWSLTAYDNETRSMIQNDLGRPLVGSVHGAKPNEDGSYDAYFGPELPDGVPEENWVQTKPGKGWFAYLRLYGPEKPYFDKTWIPGDPVRVR